MHSIAYNLYKNTKAALEKLVTCIPEKQHAIASKLIQSEKEQVRRQNAEVILKTECG